jgi:hypothetical protein
MEHAPTLPPSSHSLCRPSAGAVAFVPVVGPVGLPERASVVFRRHVYR